MQLIRIKDVCAMFGGVHPSTIYRWIKSHKVPKPVHVGPGSSRWLRQECETALATMIEGRGV